MNTSYTRAKVRLAQLPPSVRPPTSMAMLIQAVLSHEMRVSQIMLWKKYLWYLGYLINAMPHMMNAVT